MKKLALIFILIMLVSVFSACGGSADDTEGTSSSVPTDVDTVTPETTDTVIGEDGIVLLGGGASYTIVRADEADNDLVNLTVELKKYIDSKTGSSIGIATDWIKRDQTMPVGTNEILIGLTNRPESEELLNNTVVSDFSIKYIGNRVVIAAWNYDKLEEAVNYFKSKLLKIDGDKLIYTGNYSSNSGLTNLFGAQNRLDAYTIVYANGSSDAQADAKTLAAAIKKLTGTDLPVVPDKNTEKDCEILIGNTNRKATQSSKENIAVLEYRIRVVDKKIVIVGGMDSTTTIGVENFIEDFLNKKYVKTLNLTSTYNFASDNGYSVKDGEDPKLADGADLRIMSFNILAEIYNDKLPIKGRDVDTCSIIMTYEPDVIGIQEVTLAWHSTLDKYLKGNYKCAAPKIPDGRENYSTLYYNVNKVELLESKVVVFSQGNNPLLRNLTWGHFRRLSDGAEFIVTSTHWDLGTNPQYQYVHSRENADLINELAEKYKLPIFSCGDYNRNEDTEEFTYFMKTTGMQDPKYTAKKIERACKTTHTVGSKVNTSSGVGIDHIATSPFVNVLYYNTLVCKAATNTSDHCPIYIDVSIGK